jgi:spoIIIJ-associated protein
MQGDLLKKLTTDFLQALGVEFDEIVVTGTPSDKASRTVVAITSPASTLLIGQNGEHLQAINTLLRKTVERAHGEESANFLVDVNGFHEEKVERVRENARMLAQRARLFKHDVEMSPMTSYERLVVHELFAEDPEIKTESAGEGKFRHIVLKYAAK